MNNTALTSTQRFFATVLVLALLLPSVLVAWASPAGPLPIQPQLLRLAQEEPDLPVRIIVQMAGSLEELAGDVDWLGGVVLRDLGIINAAVVELPARAVPQLAQTQGVRWISLDAPVVQVSAVEDGTVIRRADFDPSLRAVNWNDWAEVGETDGFDVGDISFASFLGGLYEGVRIQGPERGIQSGLDLSQAQSAILSLAYRRKGFEDATDALRLEISGDGGATWTELTRFTGPATDPDLQFAFFDITPYISKETQIRFVSSASWSGRERFYIDYVQVEYVPQPPASYPYQVMLPVVANGAAAGGRPGAPFEVEAAANTYRYVRFVGKSEVNGDPWTSMAELNLLDGNGNLIPRDNWSIAYVDSEETVGEDGRAQNIFDGDLFSYWITEWYSNDRVHPHEVVVDLGGYHTLSGFRYLPPQYSGSSNPPDWADDGRVANYEFYVSQDGIDWGAPVAVGTLANVATEQTVNFDPAQRLGTEISVRDNFDVAAFDNNDGSGVWASPWVENDPSSGGQGPSAGQVQIVDGALRLDDYPNTGGQPSAVRSVNLSGVTSAVLAFRFRTSSGVDQDDAVVVEISGDGGASYTVLDTFTGFSGAVSGLRSYDISQFASDSTVVRFRVSNKYGGSDEFFFVDAIQLSASQSGTPVPQDAPFQEINGQVVIEAENYHALTPGSQGHTWQPVTEYSGYSGISALQALPNNGTNAQLSTSGPRLDYKVNFATPGVYTVYVRGLAPGGNTADDSVLVGINGQVAITGYWGLNGFKSYFVWPKKDTEGIATVQIPAPGVYTFNVWMREDGTVVDKFWLTQDAGVTSQGSTAVGPGQSARCADCVDPTNLADEMAPAIGADKVWNGGAHLQGKGVTVAVVDSGIALHDDLLDEQGNPRILAQVDFTGGQSTIDDFYGHGSHVAGAIGGNGARSAGKYLGIAPKVNLVDVKVTDDWGVGSTSDVVAGLQWIYDNKDTYNIRVANLSLNSTVAESYHNSPLNAALEILWFNGIVVVVSAGNNGASNSGVVYPPANDPFLMAVGAVDTQDTLDISDDVVASFSAHGVTTDGFSKPDLVVPGSDIISLLASDDSNLALEHPDHKLSGADGSFYFRMSGTSMASAVAAGAVALLLEAEPDLTPDQVKYRLMVTANTDWPGYDQSKAGAGYLDIYAAVQDTSLGSNNVGLQASQLLWTGSDPVTWGSVNWNSVNWNSVNWNSVNWNSVNWNSVNWNSVNWSN